MPMYESQRFMSGRSALNSGARWLANLAGQWASEILLPLPSQFMIQSQLFTWILGLELRSSWSHSKYLTELVIPSSWKRLLWRTNQDKNCIPPINSDAVCLIIWSGFTKHLGTRRESVFRNSTVRLLHSWSEACSLWILAYSPVCYHKTIATSPQ